MQEIVPRVKPVKTIILVLFKVAQDLLQTI